METTQPPNTYRVRNAEWMLRLLQGISMPTSLTGVYPLLTRHSGQMMTAQELATALVVAIEEHFPNPTSIGRTLLLVHTESLLKAMSANSETVAEAKAMILEARRPDRPKHGAQPAQE